jgi:Calx-beta domain
VRVTVAAGTTATNEEDFVFNMTNVTFNAGETTKILTFPIVNDALIEGEEVLVLQLGSVDARISGNTLVVRIVSDDVPPPPQGAGAGLRNVVPKVSKKRGKARVRVVDAVTGALLTVLGPFKGDLRVLLQDADGDGVNDVLVLIKNGKKTRRRTFTGTAFA